MCKERETEFTGSSLVQWIVIIAILMFIFGCSAAVACDEIALDLIDMETTGQKGKAVCVYKSRETGIDWEFPKKEMIEYRGSCPLVLMTGDPLL